MYARGSLEWYVRRLAVMPPAEIGHRVWEQVLRYAARRKAAGWEAYDCGDGALRALDPFTRFGSRQWPDGLTARIGIPERRIELLGQAWPPDCKLGRMAGSWTTDPVSRRAWPGRGTFCFDVDWSKGRIGDIKFTLELNRLQLLQPMAATAMRDKCRRTAVQAADILLDWMDENPPFEGVNWTFMIELALRLVSVSFVVAALEATGGTALYRRRLRSCVAAHAYWIARFPSLYSSNNNHRVAEGLGLLIASELVPDLPQAAAYRATGRAILVDAARSQFHPDGTGREQSPTYSAFTAEMILLGIVLARAGGVELPSHVQEQVAAATAQLRALLDDAGHAPRIGDDDEGRVLADPCAHEARYVASVVAAAAGVLARPDLAPPARDPHLRDVAFGSPCEHRPIAAGIQTFADGGCTVIREDVAGHRMMLVMDHGPLGLDPLAAHGHADALAVWLHLDGCPVWIDAGTLQYHHADPALRDWLRSTPAHNTVTIGGVSQSLTAGGFNWRHKAQSRLLQQRDGADWLVAGNHDGYLERFGCLHQRTCRRSQGGFEIIDELQGERSAEPPVEIGFLVHPDLDVVVSGSQVRIVRDGQALLIMQPQFECEIRASGAGDGGNASLYSPRYNRTCHGTRLTFLPQSITTALVTRVEICRPGQASKQA